MIASRRVLAGLLAVLGLAANQPASAQAPVPSVSLVTYGPGQVYWERFGHNALVFRDPLSGRGTSYNYGMFDFEEADFMLNFALGRMQYQIAAEDADEEIAWYRSEGRSILEQELNLDASQVLALKAYLETNLLPENRRYPYDYFTSNCSTRIRDALDKVLGGALRKQLTSPSRVPPLFVRPSPPSNRPHTDALRDNHPHPRLMRTCWTRCSAGRCASN